MVEALDFAAGQNVALVCAERNPRDCHRASKLLAWVHQRDSSPRGRHIVPAGDDCEVIDSRELERGLDPAHIWWELHPEGQYGRPEGP